jgi:dihydrodipicolinate reductase
MVSCWAVMAPMVIGAQPMGVLMLVGTTAVTAERLSRTPKRARQFGAALLAASAIAIGIGALSLHMNVGSPE